MSLLSLRTRADFRPWDRDCREMDKHKTPIVEMTMYAICHCCNLHSSFLPCSGPVCTHELSYWTYIRGAIS